MSDYINRNAKALRYLLVSVILLVGFEGSQCFADIWGDTISWQATGSPITATDGWENTDTSLTWSVDLMGSYYRYEYTFTVPTDAAVKSLSHFILQTSDTFDLWGLDEEGFVNASLDPVGLDAFLDTYEPTTDKPNPGMPGNIYGLKFENDEDPLTDEFFGTGSTWTWSFNSWREPVWGHFYAVDGQEGGGSSMWVYAYNSSFGTPFSGDTFGYIAVPDTTLVPVPSAVLLGILGLGAAGIKLRKIA